MRANKIPHLTGADTTSTFWTAGSLQVQGQVLGPNIGKSPSPLKLKNQPPNPPPPPPPFSSLTSLPPTEICTTDVSKCLAHGDSTDGKTPGTTFSSWCLVYASGKTGFVIADKNHGFSGAPGHSCINGAQMTKLGVWAANNCRGGSKVVDVAGGGAKGDGAGVSNNGQWQQVSELALVFLGIWNLGVRKERGVWADDFCGLGGRRCVSSIRIIPRCAFLDWGELLGKWCGYGEVGIGVWATGGGGNREWGFDGVCAVLIGVDALKYQMMGDLQ